MVDEAARLITALQLAPHPEGGFYRQIYKSPRRAGSRAALTIIYFLLPAGEVSRWHRVASDEVWTHLQGDPLRLHIFDGAAARTHIVGPLSDAAAPVAVVPAGHWQAAEPLGSYALVACLVAPGFEFADFTLMSDDAEAAARLPEELRRFV